MLLFQLENIGQNLEVLETLSKWRPYQNCKEATFTEDFIKTGHN